MHPSFLKSRARHNLKGKWEVAIVTILLSFLVSVAVDVVFGKKYFEGDFYIFLIRLFFDAPVKLGMCIVFLAISRGGNPQASLIFEGFRSWLKSFLLIVLYSLFVILWSLLLVVPGIIKAISYSMGFFIMADEPDITASESIRRSRLMMHGHKTEFLILNLSFIGWLILSLFTFGILFILYVGPLYLATVTEFYEALQESSDF